MEKFKLYLDSDNALKYRDTDVFKSTIRDLEKYDKRVISTEREIRRLMEMNLSLDNIVHHKRSPNILTHRVPFIRASRYLWKFIKPSSGRVMCIGPAAGLVGRYLFYHYDKLYLDYLTGDVYLTVASRMYDTHPNEISHIQRQNAKIAMYRHIFNDTHKLDPTTQKLFDKAWPGFSTRTSKEFQKESNQKMFQFAELSAFYIRVMYNLHVVPHYENIYIGVPGGENEYNLAMNLSATFDMYATVKCKYAYKMSDCLSMDEATYTPLPLHVSNV